VNNFHVSETLVFLVQICERLYRRNCAKKTVHICMMYVSEIVVIVVNMIINYVNVMFEFVRETGNNFLRIFTYSWMQYYL